MRSIRTSATPDGRHCGDRLAQGFIGRVCGFSARFVSLSKRWQDEVIARHRLW